jgi:integrase
VPCEDVAAARGRAVGLASCVVRWLKKGEPMPAWIFPSPEGTALEERNVRTVFARLICIHDLRHTYSTLLLQTGAPITYVSQQPGRLDASIALRVYAHWLPDMSRRVDPLDPLQPDATPAQPEVVPTTNRPSVSRLF